MTKGDTLEKEIDCPMCPGARCTLCHGSGKTTKAALEKWVLTPRENPYEKELALRQHAIASQPADPKLQKVGEALAEGFLEKMLKSYFHDSKAQKVGEAAIQSAVTETPLPAPEGRAMLQDKSKGYPMDEIEQAFIGSLIGKQVRVLTPHNIQFTGTLVAATTTRYFLEDRRLLVENGLMTSVGESYRRMIDRGPGTMIEPYQWP